MKPLVSVIVPIYNSEKYLGKCLDSIIGQTYDDLEIVLVDDGSTDRSLEICEEYKKNDNRIRIFRKNNGGPGSARKMGVINSHGAFVTPVDSDDWIEPDMISAMMNIACDTKAQVVQCGIRYCFENADDVYYNEPLDEGLYDLTDTNNKVFDNLFYGRTGTDDRVRSNLCTCLFERSLYEKIQLSIPDEIVNGDDDACYYLALLNGKSYYFCEEIYYNHPIRHDSVGRTGSLFSMEQVSLMDALLLGEVQKHKACDKLLWRYKKYILAYSVQHISNLRSIGVRNNFIFPREESLRGKKIIVYGAGNVGKSYVYQNNLIDWFELVAWIDGNITGSWEGITIFSKEYLKEVEFDFILIAVEKELIAQEISKELVGFGIDKSRIIWIKPEKDICSYYVDA